MGNPPFKMYMSSHQPRKGVGHSITIMGLWGELTITGRPRDVFLTVTVPDAQSRTMEDVTGAKGFRGSMKNVNVRENVNHQESDSRVGEEWCTEVSLSTG